MDRHHHSVSLTAARAICIQFSLLAHRIGDTELRNRRPEGDHDKWFVERPQQDPFQLPMVKLADGNSELEALNNAIEGLGLESRLVRPRLEDELLEAHHD